MKIFRNDFSIRKLERSDLPSRVKWINSPDINEFLTFDYPVSLSQTEAWFNKTLLDRSKQNFTIIKNKEGVETPIGMVGLINIDFINRRAEFYITIGEKDYWGQGISKEVISWALEYSFSYLGLNKVYLTTHNDNVRAKKLYEKSGFVLEGVLRDNLFHRGQFIDTAYYSILKGDK